MDDMSVFCAKNFRRLYRPIDSFFFLYNDSYYMNLRYNSNAIVYLFISLGA